MRLCRRTRHGRGFVSAVEAGLPESAAVEATSLWATVPLRPPDRAWRALAGYRADIKERARIRGVYAALAAGCDGFITLAAPGAAPEGLASTGNPEFGVPSSLLGVPALSLPLFEDGGMPLGLQLIGFFDADADAVAMASWLMQAK